MNLRLRLNLMISAAFLLALATGGMLTVGNARQAVALELGAAAELAHQLIALALADSSDANNEARLLQRIGELETVRHLTIEVQRGEDAAGMTRPASAPADDAPLAPTWFVRLVAPAPIEFTEPLNTPDGGVVRVRADPSAEIAEAWAETRSVLAIMLATLLVANALVFYASGRALRPLAQVLSALDGIERGDYRQRLPEFRLPELRQLGRKFNSMAQRLQQSTEENRYLARRTQAIQEEERRHLSRELHDQLGQCLTAVKANAVSISRRSGGRLPGIHESANAIVALSSEMHELVRNMMRKLRPAMLDELGLTATLQETVADWRRLHPDISCTLMVADGLDAMGEDVSINLYRTVQECLTNVARHAHAGHVEIRLECKDADNKEHSPSIRLIVRDDGQGFDPQVPPAGLGLAGIRERAQALFGTVHVASRKGAGTCVQIEFPAPIAITG